MSYQLHSLVNAVAGTTGEAVTVTSTVSVSVSATTWGGEAVTLQTYNEQTEQWSAVAGATFTTNANEVLRLGTGERVRAITSGSGGTMVGVSVYFVMHVG